MIQVREETAHPAPDQTDTIDTMTVEARPLEAEEGAVVAAVAAAAVEIVVEATPTTTQGLPMVMVVMIKDLLPLLQVCLLMAMSKTLIMQAPMVVHPVARPQALMVALLHIIKDTAALASLKVRLAV
jgi:hypothetical protein